MEKKPIQISGVVISYNEEANIVRCLKSLVPVVDELLVVDSLSTDKTVELAQSLGAKVIHQKFLGYIEQKNFALNAAKYSIVLSLDADECLSEELINEVQKIKNDWSADAYTMKRLTNYAGHWVRYCGWYPDRKLRLFDKNKGSWGGSNPHDLVIMGQDAKTNPIQKGDILHYSYNSVSDHVHQTNRFTTIAAQAAYDKGTRSNWFKILTRPPLKFLRDYFFKLGFLDGKYGLIICVINGLSAFLKFVKLKELQKN